MGVGTREEGSAAEKPRGGGHEEGRGHRLGQDRHARAGVRDGMHLTGRQVDMHRKEKRKEENKDRANTTSMQ